MRIYVAAHIRSGAPRLPYLSFIQTGAAEQETWPEFIRDDVGEHISHKNKSFCELTALYWIWKNTLDPHIGLCHYRRFFSSILFSDQNRSGAAVPLEIAQRLLDLDQYGSILEAEVNLADMIVPMRDPRPRSAVQMYSEHCRVDDWNAMLSGMSELYPLEREPAERFFCTNYPLHYYNMMITKRSRLNEYCEWLFPLLFHLERAIIPSTDPYQHRVFGFLAERLFNWYTVSRGLKLIERPVLQIL